MHLALGNFVRLKVQPCFHYMWLWELVFCFGLIRRFGVSCTWLANFSGLRFSWFGHDHEDHGCPGMKMDGSDVCSEIDMKIPPMSLHTAKLLFIAFCFLYS